MNCIDIVTAQLWGTGTGRTANALPKRKTLILNSLAFYQQYELCHRARFRAED